jgi:transcription-repair coupling factor (superfamily II helicase)
VAKNTDKIVRDAILSEVDREGQVFYLHNRILSIHRVRERLETLVPEVRIEIAHGRMASSELSAVMRRFVEGEFDVLLCTTIIESGMDIPRANTILIDRADRFGIADLYQLRGRVGRSRQKAYAYLLLPPQGNIDSIARDRIGALRKYSDLSVGFRLALRDLEIRGSGNLLGSEQSGYIAAIGFGLYCQLLRQTVARLKHEPAPPLIDVEIVLDFVDLSASELSPLSSASIPYAYVEDERLRIGLYRKIAEAARLQELADLRAELQDRFGPPPAPAERLLRIAELRLAAAERGIGRVETDDDKLMLSGRDGFVMRNGRFPRLNSATPDEKIAEIVAYLRA